VQLGKTRIKRASTRNRLLGPVKNRNTREERNQMTDKTKSRQNLLQTIALTSLLIGAVGSLFFMFKAGSNQKSIILIGLFTAWVLSPFVGLFFANKVPSNWPASKRQLLHYLILGLTIVSLIAYSGLVKLPGTKPAFIFLVHPFVSWLTILTIFFISKKHK
jgi:hypothetical protein